MEIDKKLTEEQMQAFALEVAKKLHEKPDDFAVPPIRKVIGSMPITIGTPAPAPESAKENVNTLWPSPRDMLTTAIVYDPSKTTSFEDEAEKIKGGHFLAPELFSGMIEKLQGVDIGVLTAALNDILETEGGNASQEKILNVLQSHYSGIQELIHRISSIVSDNYLKQATKSSTKEQHRMRLRAGFIATQVIYYKLRNWAGSANLRFADAAFQTLLYPALMRGITRHATAQSLFMHDVAAHASPIKQPSDVPLPIRAGSERETGSLANLASFANAFLSSKPHQPSQLLDHRKFFEKLTIFVWKTYGLSTVTADEETIARRAKEAPAMPAMEFFTYRSGNSFSLNCMSFDKDRLWHIVAKAPSFSPVHEGDLFSNTSGKSVMFGLNANGWVRPFTPRYSESLLDQSSTRIGKEKESEEKLQSVFASLHAQHIDYLKETQPDLLTATDLGSVRIFMSDKRKERHIVFEKSKANEVGKAANIRLLAREEAEVFMREEFGIEDASAELEKFDIAQLVVIRRTDDITLRYTDNQALQAEGEPKRKKGHGGDTKSEQDKDHNERLKLLVALLRTVKVGADIEIYDPERVSQDGKEATVPPSEDEQTWKLNAEKKQTAVVTIPTLKMQIVVGSRGQGTYILHDTMLHATAWRSQTPQSLDENGGVRVIFDKLDQWQKAITLLIENRKKNAQERPLPTGKTAYKNAPIHQLFSTDEVIQKGAVELFRRDAERILAHTENNRTRGKKAQTLGEMNTYHFRNEAGDVFLEAGGAISTETWLDAIAEKMAEEQKLEVPEGGTVRAMNMATIRKILKLLGEEVMNSETEEGNSGN